MLKYYFLLLLFPFCHVSAQHHPKDMVLCTNVDGIDAYPVYQTSAKNAFIDSIVYAGPFIIFCVSFQKPNADKTFHLEPPQSDKSWICNNYRATRHPMQILNVRCNHQLIAEKLSEQPLDIVFENDNSSASFSKISCDLLFWRADFAHGEANLSQFSTTQYSIDQASNAIEFKDIKIRKKHFTKPLYKDLIDQYINHYSWEENKLYKNIEITLNEKIVDHSTFKRVPQTHPYKYHSLKYAVEPKNQHLLYLDKVHQKGDQTIFSIRCYVSKHSRVTLYNANPNKYYLQHKSKRVKMNGIQNICLNGKLIAEQLKNGEILKIRKIKAAAMLTFEVSFDQLPKDFFSFDLIEGKQLKRSIPFDLFKIQL